MVDPRQSNLRKMVDKDLEGRSLEGADAPQGQRTLHSEMDCLLRCIDAALMKRASSCSTGPKKNKHLAGAKELDVLAQDAVEAITSVSCTKRERQLLGVDDDVYEAMLAQDGKCLVMPWVKMAVLLQPGMTQYKATSIQR